MTAVEGRILHEGIYSDEGWEGGNRQGDMITMLLPILTPKYVVRREERGLAVATSPRLAINDADIRDIFLYS